MTATETTTLRLYSPNSLTNYWVVEDVTKGQLWLVPAVDQGWTKRTRYYGDRTGISVVPSYCWIGLGVPLRRDWKTVCADRTGHN